MTNPMKFLFVEVLLCYGTLFLKIFFILQIWNQHKKFWIFFTPILTYFEINFFVLEGGSFIWHENTVWYPNRKAKNVFFYFGLKAPTFREKKCKHELDSEKDQSHCTLLHISLETIKQIRFILFFLQHTAARISSTLSLLADDFLNFSPANRRFPQPEPC
jgi:hypothetical protein